MLRGISVEIVYRSVHVVLVADDVCRVFQGSSVSSPTPAQVHSSSRCLCLSYVFVSKPKTVVFWLSSAGLSVCCQPLSHCSRSLLMQSCLLELSTCQTCLLGLPMVLLPSISPTLLASLCIMQFNVTKITYVNFLYTFMRYFVTC